MVEAVNQVIENFYNDYWSIGENLHILTSTLAILRIQDLNKRFLPRLPLIHFRALFLDNWGLLSSLNEVLGLCNRAEVGETRSCLVWLGLVLPNKHSRVRLAIWWEKHLVLLSLVVGWVLKILWELLSGLDNTGAEFVHEAYELFKEPFASNVDLFLDLTLGCLNHNFWNLVDEFGFSLLSSLSCFVWWLLISLTQEDVILLLSWDLILQWLAIYFTNLGLRVLSEIFLTQRLLESGCVYQLVLFIFTLSLIMGLPFAKKTLVIGLRRSLFDLF